jgi:hypothetical protein
MLTGKPKFLCSPLKKLPGAASVMSSRPQILASTSLQARPQLERAMGGATAMRSRPQEFLSRRAWRFSLGHHPARPTTILDGPGHHPASRATVFDGPGHQPAVAGRSDRIPVFDPAESPRYLARAWRST